MFSYLKNIIDIVTIGANQYRSYNSKKDREKSISELLETYFLMKDCADDGKLLIEDAGDNPIQKIKDMDSEQSIHTLKNWDSILRKQGFRLNFIKELIFDQKHLVVINPDLVEKINSVIGSKTDRVLTLHSIGATLFLNAMFPIEDSDEEKARLVALMSGTSKDIIDMKTSIFEIEELYKSLEKYREVINQLSTPDEILTLSKHAREETLLDDI